MNIHPDLARLSEQLRDGYAASPRGEKMTALHLFGIVHADELSGLTSAELESVATVAGLSPSFATELRKMVKLSRFVVPREGVAGSAAGPLSSVFRRLARSFPADYKFDREEANAR